MAKTRLTCENCGFGEELGNKQLQERIDQDGALTCPACGAALTLPEGGTHQERKKSNSAKKSRYAGLEAMTGLDDVLEDEIPEETPAAEEATEPQVRATSSGAEAESKKETLDGQQAVPAGSGQDQAEGTARETLKKTFCHGWDNPLFAAGLIDKIFKCIAAGAEGRFDKGAVISLRIGHYTLLGVAVLAMIFGALISLRSLSLDPLLTGLTLAAMLFFAQYLALRGFELLETYIEKNPSILPGTAITDILSAFSVLAGMLSLLIGLIITVNFYSPVWLGLSALGLICGYFAAAALLECRSCLNVRFDDALPWSETIVEVAAAILKTMAAVSPFIFGLGSAAMSLCMIWPTVSMLLFNLNISNTASFFLQETGLLFCAFSPIIIYFFILIWAFIIQAARVLLGQARAE